MMWCDNNTSVRQLISEHEYLCWHHYCLLSINADYWSFISILFYESHKDMDLRPMFMNHENNWSSVCLCLCLGKSGPRYKSIFSCWIHKIPQDWFVKVYCVQCCPIGRGIYGTAIPTGLVGRFYFEKSSVLCILSTAQYDLKTHNMSLGTQ